MENGDTFLFLLDMLGIGFLIFYGWYVFIQKNDPGVVGLSVSAIVSIQLVGTFIDLMAG